MLLCLPAATPANVAAANPQPEPLRLLLAPLPAAPRNEAKPAARIAPAPINPLAGTTPRSVVPAHRASTPMVSTHKIDQPHGKPGAPLSVASLLSQVTEAPAPTPTPSANGRLVYGSSARGYLWQQYMDDWVNKMERLGSLNYPEEVRRQGLTGGPTLSVVINADGSLAEIRIVNHAGNATLDAAAEQIVRAAAPFAPFPPALASQARSLEIRRRWHFSTGNDLSVQ
jgi:protein TonB